MNAIIVRAACAGVFACLGVSAAFAQQPAAAPAAPPPPPVEQSFRSLLSEGYAVVGTAYVAAEAFTSKNPAFLVTLQKQNTVAVCTFGAAQWETISNNAAVDDQKACDVLKP